MKKYTTLLSLLFLGCITLTFGCNVQGPGVFWAAAQSVTTVQDDLSKSETGAFAVYTEDNTVYYAFTGSALVRTEANGTHVWNEVTGHNAGIPTHGIFLDNAFYGVFRKGADSVASTVQKYDIPAKKWSSVTLPEGTNAIAGLWGRDGETPYITYTVGENSEENEQGRTFYTAPFTGGAVGTPIATLNNVNVKIIRGEYLVTAQEGDGSQVYTVTGAAATPFGKAISDVITDAVVHKGELYLMGEKNAIYLVTSSDTTTITIDEDNSSTDLFVTSPMVAVDYKGHMLLSNSKGIYMLDGTGTTRKLIRPTSTLINSDHWVQYLGSSQLKSFYLDGNKLLLGGVSSVGEGAVWLVAADGTVTRIHEIEQ